MPKQELGAALHIHSQEQGHEELSKFKTSLISRASRRTAWATKRNPVSNHHHTPKQKSRGESTGATCPGCFCPADFLCRSYTVQGSPLVPHCSGWINLLILRNKQDDPLKTCHRLTWFRQHLTGTCFQENLGCVKLAELTSRELQSTATQMPRLHLFGSLHSLVESAHRPVCLLCPIMKPNVGL